MADFIFETYPCNLTVTFTDTSSHDPTNWSWQFGDGTTSSVQNPVHVYAAPGTYLVNLTVQKTCSDGTPRQSSVSKTVGVSQIFAPVANFTYKQSSGCANFNVQFTDISAGNPVNWSWNFGDGTTSSLQNPSHMYTTTGTFHVNLTVENICGIDTVTKPIIVDVCPPPVADFIFETYPCNLTVTFTDTSSQDPTNWSWQFGDGTTSSVQNPVHV